LFTEITSKLYCTVQTVKAVFLVSRYYKGWRGRFLSWEGRERDNIGNPAQISSENYRRKVATRRGRGTSSSPRQCLSEDGALHKLSGLSQNSPTKIVRIITTGTKGSIG
jgi:hypothetical protein